METILRIEGLKKSFRSHWTFLPVPALRGISLEVFAGEAFGFLGPNGAGKTTTIKCIMGLVHPNGGRIELKGKELKTAEQRALLGYLPEQPYFYDHLTVLETMQFFAALYGHSGKPGRERAAECLELVGLADRARHSVRSLSKGLQQRLGLAQSIINKPLLLVLDEPFSGLDPLGRAEFRQTILSLKQQGTTIFMSSHILSDVSEICDRVVILNRGEVRASFRLDEAAARFGEDVTLSVREAEMKGDLLDMLKKACSRQEKSASALGRQFTFHFTDYEAARRCAAAVLASGARITELNEYALTLEQIFMKIVEADRSGT